MDSTETVSSSESGGSFDGPKDGDLILNRFKLIKKLGEGGMGEVWEAEDKLLSASVALKFFSKANLSSKKLQRIKREVLKGRELLHKNLLKYYEVFEDEKYLFFSMELIKGKTLQEALKERDLKEGEIKEFLKQITEALEYIHSQWIIHRDVKPSNIFIKEDGSFVLGDLGILYLEEEEQLTGTKEIIGTLHYIPPEAFERKITPSYDYYSLGITLFEITTKKLPFDGTEAEIIKGHQFKEPPKIKNKVSKKLKRLINGLLIKKPEKRWGEREIKKYIKGVALPILPKEKKSFSVFVLLFILFILIIYFTPKLLTPEPTSVEFKGKKLKVYSKRGLLFEKEMEKEISDAKIVEKGREKEIAVSYKIEPNNFYLRPDNQIKFGEILNKKGKFKDSFKTMEKSFYFFKNFSLHYISKILFFPKIKDKKILSKNDFCINLHHLFYPSIIGFAEGKILYPNIISSEGYIYGICDWEGKFVIVGSNNILFHQLFIAYVNNPTIPINQTIELLGPNKLINSYNLLGYLGFRITAKFYPKGENLLIEIPELDEKFILKPNGDLEGYKENNGFLTRKFCNDNNEIKVLLKNNSFKKAEELIKDDLNLSKDYGLYGWTIVFASYLSNLEFLRGKKEMAVQICLEYASKYPKYGLDLKNKAAFLSMASDDYKRAKNIWKSELAAKGYRMAEVTIFPFFCEILDENWEGADQMFINENVALSDIWHNYWRYLKGLIYLLKKDTKKATEILKPSLEDIEQQDNATFYFLSKVAEGKPDTENYEKYMRNYIEGPLYLQFAGACTKGNWDRAKILYNQMEGEQIWDTGVALIFPVIKKIIKIYPEKFKFLK